MSLVYVPPTTIAKSIWILLGIFLKRRWPEIGDLVEEDITFLPGPEYPYPIIERFVEPPVEMVSIKTYDDPDLFANRETIKLEKVVYKDWLFLVGYGEQSRHLYIWPAQWNIPEHEEG